MRFGRPKVSVVYLGMRLAFVVRREEGCRYSTTYNVKSSSTDAFLSRSDSAVWACRYKPVDCWIQYRGTRTVLHQAGLCAGSSSLKLLTADSPTTSAPYQLYPSLSGTPVGGHGSAPRMNHSAADQASAQPQQHERLHLSLITMPKRR